MMLKYWVRRTMCDVLCIAKVHMMCLTFSVDIISGIGYQTTIQQEHTMIQMVVIYQLR